MRSASVLTVVERSSAKAHSKAIISGLILVFCLSLTIHLAIAALFINQPIALDDMFQYDMLARSLSTGNGYRWYAKADVEVLKPYMSQFLDLDKMYFPENGIETAFRSPGYPFFLAGLYLLVPQSLRFIIARIAQAILMAALAPLVIGLGNLAGFRKRTSALAGVAISLYPILLFYPIGLASEDLFIPLVLLSLLLLLIAAERRSLGWVVGAGLICGSAILTRSIFAAFVVLASLWLGKYSLRGKKAGLILAGVAFGICMPWAIRNSAIMHKPAFVENSLGYNLFVGYHPQGDGGFVSKIAIMPLSITDDAERDRVCMQEALRFIRSNPLEAIGRVFSRVVEFIGPEDREFRYFYSNNLVGPISQPWLAIVYLLLLVPWMGTVLFGIPGLWLAPKRSTVILVSALLIGYTLPHLFILAEPRFHLTLVPVLMPFAAFGWEQKHQLVSEEFWGEDRRNLLLLALAVIIVAAWILKMGDNWQTLLQLMGPKGNTLAFPY